MATGAVTDERVLEALMLPGEPVATLTGLLLRRPAWMAHAACRDHPRVNFFPRPGESLEPARAVCAACPVRLPCVDYAVSDPDLGGVWGGTSPRQRVAIRRQAS